MIETRQTPPIRAEPDTNEMIFVFGSNLAGRHGAGAALYARQHRGAVYGIGIGPRGQSYALPTKDDNLNTISLAVIQLFVNGFLDYAQQHSKLTFQITRIGCGLAGYTDAQIAPLFLSAPANCIFSHHWSPWFPTHRLWTDMY